MWSKSESPQFRTNENAIINILTLTGLIRQNRTCTDVRLRRLKSVHTSRGLNCIYQALAKQVVKIENNEFEMKLLMQHA